MEIKVLDCTLRDGGYVNNWCFGHKTICATIEKLAASSIEYIECGFLSQTQSSDESRSIFSSFDEAEKCIPSNCGGLALMINCGEYAPEDLPEYGGGPINTVRIAFHKHQRDEARELFCALKERGYSVFFQPMVTMSYNDLELLELIEWANSHAPAAFYIVDSFGTMRKSDVLRIFYLMDNNLDKKIKIGFHSHNNLQLSFSNAQELILMNSEREMIIDSSVLGIGRGAGNLCTELLTQYINENIENRYDLIPILEIMDEHIMPIYAAHPWGYSAPYYIAAINSCHPNYATWLMGMQTLCIKDISAIIKGIPVEKRHLFDKELIDRLYLEYQSHSIDDRAAIKEISEMCGGRKVLVLAPGKSLLTHRDKIEKYIEDEKPFVIGVNHIPRFHRYDRIFVSNLKRFKGIDDAVSMLRDKMICTSNISTGDGVCAVNYSDYLNDNEAIYDNSGLVMINILKKAGVTDIALAGYDGFDYAGAKNYFDESMINNMSAQRQSEMNSAIIDYFVKARKSMNINFITPTIYSGEQDNEQADRF